MLIQENWCLIERVSNKKDSLVQHNPVSEFVVRISLIGIFCFFVYEIVNDIIGGESLAHHMTETFFFLLTFIILIIHVNDAYQTRKELQALKAREEQKSAEPSEQIQKQLEEWKLTPSEQEISWLIVKGFSFAEIAHIRSVKEKTIRAHATNIYQKSGTENRNDFAARFIDDLLNAS